MIDSPAALISNAGVPTLVYGIPIVGGVTAGTVQAEHPGVKDRVAVTARAVGGQPGELTRGMATLARHSCMPTRQWKVTAVVIEIDMLPTRGIMTRRTIGAILTVMFIIQLMAGITVAGCALMLLILVARFTGYFAMLAFQFERGKIVIEFCRSPALRGVALTAIGSKTALMRFIAKMTGIAIL